MGDTLWMGTPTTKYALLGFDLHQSALLIDDPSSSVVTFPFLPTEILKLILKRN